MTSFWHFCISESISFVLESRKSEICFCSLFFVIGNNIFPIKSHSALGIFAPYVEESIILSDKVYNYAGIKYDGHNIPVIPTNIQLDYDMFDQCLRQWVRANYSKKYNLNPASDYIQYYVLADVLRVVLSDVSEESREGQGDVREDDRQ